MRPEHGRQPDRQGDVGQVAMKAPAMMNPAALTRGLADSLPKNVSLHEHTPVTQAEFSKSRVNKNTEIHPIVGDQR